MAPKPDFCLHAVIFDYGKVLSFEPTPEDWNRLASVAGRPLREFQRDYWESRVAYDRDDCSAAEYWKQVAGRDLAPEVLHELTALDNDQWTRVNPSMLELSRQLRAAGVKTAILSNMEFEMLAAMRAKFPWLNEFQAQIYSCEVGLVKPETEIYLRAAVSLEVQAAQTLFLDDKQPNVDGAQEAGMQALLFDSPERQVELEAFLRKHGVLLPPVPKPSRPNRELQPLENPV